MDYDEQASEILSSIFLLFSAIALAVVFAPVWIPLTILHWSVVGILKLVDKIKYG